MRSIRKNIHIAKAVTIEPQTTAHVSVIDDDIPPDALITANILLDLPHGILFVGCRVSGDLSQIDAELQNKGEISFSLFNATNETITIPCEPLPYLRFVVVAFILEEPSRSNAAAVAEMLKNPVSVEQALAQVKEHHREAERLERIERDKEK